MPEPVSVSEITQLPDVPLLALEPTRGLQRSPHAEQESEQVRGEDVGQLSVLKRAVRNCELTLRFQPIVSLQEGLPRGVEARATWQDPHRGVRSAETLMELADRHGVVTSLISAQTEQACALVTALGSGSSGRERPVVHLSIATKYLSDRVVVDDVVAVVSSAAIDPARLVITLNGATSLARRSQLHDGLRTLRTAGVGLALGHFGTDSWSMSDLRDFPVTSVSIDASFVSGLPQRSDDVAIISSLVLLAHELGLACMAEGVKDRGQASTLHLIGCDSAVGPYWGLPVPEAEVEFLLKRLGQTRPQPVRSRR
jgi:EAL domain-containing protein (putative c-di-GMP-specific phosphodiesterase class I)